MEGKKAVLLVEDAEHLRKTVRDLLQADGFQVCDCSDAESALQAAEINEFYFIITDYRLPSLNGADAIRCLRRRFPEAVIIGASWDDLQKVFLAAGADFFLQKPFEYRDLRDLMNNKTIPET
jgi:DNA-binding response OmpR family regulator